MDRLQSMQVFVRVAQHSSFAAAARELRISPAAASKQVSALEAHVGARLLDRTTRRVGLTEAGHIYLERCLECLHALEDADASMSELAKAPSGVLRITAPVDFGAPLLPVLNALMAANESLGIDLRLSNRVMDMVEEGVDVAVRIARSLDARYVARPVARTRLSVLAAPAYLARHGEPRKPEDLAAHRHVVFTEPRPMQELTLRRGRREVRVKLPAVMWSNSGEALMSAARQGIGMAVAPSFLACGDLASGALRPVLPEWSLLDFTVYAVYPHRRLVAPKVRLFLEALTATFGHDLSDPWWPQSPVPTPATVLPRRRRAQSPADATLAVQ